MMLRRRATLLFSVLALVPLISAGASNAAPAAPDAEGFVRIFDGATLAGWDGDPTYWRVEDGCLVGEITPATIVQRNTFIIWRGGQPRDFELKLQYRVSEHGNSGINYRSIQLPDAPWSLAGYQADIDGQNDYTGQNYEERGRTFLARSGQVVVARTGGKIEPIATLGERAELTTGIRPDGWNDYHLIVRGPHLIHIVNGRVMSVVLDEDTAHRRDAGWLGVQVHVGPPMKIEYREIRLKPL